MYVSAAAVPWDCMELLAESSCLRSPLRSNDILVNTQKDLPRSLTLTSANRRGKQEVCQQDWNFTTSAEIFRSSACLHRSSLSASSFSLRTAQEFFFFWGGGFFSPDFEFQVFNFHIIDIIQEDSFWFCDVLGSNSLN